MKPDFKAGQGHRKNKGDKVSNIGWERRRAKRSTRMFTLHAQTMCDRSMSNVKTDMVVTQWRNKEGVTYYTAKATELKYMPDQYCEARIEVGKAIKVVPSELKGVWHPLDKTNPGNTNDEPEF